ncbi:DUF1631 domain-containing protein [Pseudomonadales bacterium]|nr:DUF1631 domain-containing protein [Pseudomonadales bacterium]
MHDLVQRLTPEKIATALLGFYAPHKPTSATLPRAELIELLENLPALSAAEHVDPVLVQVEKYHSNVILSQADRATLAYIDDCVTQILRQTDLDFRIEAFIRNLTPYIAVMALRQGVKSIFEPQPILNLMNTLINEGLGWSEDLGILGEQFMDKIELMVRAMVSSRMSLEDCQSELDLMFSKDKPIFKKMEARLLDVEMKVLSRQKAKYYAAELLNQQMTDKKLPLFMIFVLQGSWYEFLQQVLSAYGEESPAWQKVTKLTEALIWSIQVQPDTARQATLMESLAGHIQAFCQKMNFDTSAVEACLEDLALEHEAIREGTPSSACDFELIKVEQSSLLSQQQLDASVLADIREIQPGQWYLHDDKRDPEEKVARIKLILNWQDTMRLLFTNHNRRKVLHMSYPEFAQYLAEGTLKPLSPKSSTWEVIKQHLLTVVQGVQVQKQKESKVETPQDKKLVTREYLDRRKNEIMTAMEQHKRTAELKQKRALVLREKAQQKILAATNAIESLRVDAWLKLPVMEGTLTPCRLVAVIAAADKYIFANRHGLKVGEFSKGQLIQMLIAENSEILDTGAEFENVLSSVVSALRDNKNKSYDELTGANA